MLCLLGLAGGAQQQEPVTIRVDTAVRKGPMPPIWAWFGHDEPNYTYTTNGKKLLSELAGLSPVPVFVRVHNLLTTGDGTRRPQVGIDQRRTRKTRGPADLRLDDRRPHRRHLHARAR